MDANKSESRRRGQWPIQSMAFPGNHGVTFSPLGYGGTD